MPTRRRVRTRVGSSGGRSCMAESSIWARLGLHVHVHQNTCPRYAHGRPGGHAQSKTLLGAHVLR
eukprot:6945459-Prymnesium_polylepis.1